MTDAWPLIKALLRIAGVAIGGMFLGVMIYIAVEQTPFFLRSDSRPFWEDAKAHLLKQPEAKTLAELRAIYGEAAVRERITNPLFDLVYLPSEDAAFLNLLANEHNMRLKRADGIPILVDWAVVLVCIYLPVMFGARRAQQALSWLACRTARSRQRRAVYLHRLRESRWSATLFGFALTVGLCTLAAVRDYKPEYGLTLLELAAGRVLLSYLGGMWMKLVSHLVDVALMVSGRDPDDSIWDEAIALALVSPVLVLVYQNSLTGVVLSATAGLASGLYRKWKRRNKHAAGTAAAAA